MVNFQDVKSVTLDESVAGEFRALVLPDAFVNEYFSSFDEAAFNNMIKGARGVDTGFSWHAREEYIS